MTDETIAMEPSGRVLPIFRGEYDASRTYENPDIVLYRNSSYVAKKTTVGNPPPADAFADDYWQMVARGIIDADVSDATVALTYESEEREALQSGETANTLFSKIKRWYSDFATVVFTGKYSDLTGTPDLKVVATSGNYNDLSNKPTALPASDVPTWAKQTTKPTYSKSDVGLGNVNNTSDQNKPVSTAQQTALDKKVNFTDITQSIAVNIAGKKALDAIEKNPSVAGTLANQLQQVNSNLNECMRVNNHGANYNGEDVISAVRSHPPGNNLITLYLFDNTTPNVPDNSGWWSILSYRINDDVMLHATNTWNGKFASAHISLNGTASEIGWRIYE